MIIQIFDNRKNGSATGAVNYILSLRDWKGNIREVAPKILEGSPSLTREIDEIYCQKYANKCISGVIAFADDEDLNDKQKKQLIEDFEKTFLGNMRDKTNVLYVEHRDKGNLEIHFVINRVAILESGKALAYNPFPPGKMNIELKDCFRDLQNEKFGFKHVVEDPLKTKLTKGERQARRLDKDETSFLHFDSKDKLERAIRKLVKDGTVSNRDELLKFLVAQGLKVKTTANSISIENKHVEAKSDYAQKYGSFHRFKDGIFSRSDDKSYKEIKAEAKEKAAKPKNFEAIAKKLERLVQARNDYNSKRYEAAEKAPPKFAAKIAASSQNAIQDSSLAKTSQHKQQPEKTAHSPANQAAATTTQPKNADSYTSERDDSREHVADGAIHTGNEAAGAAAAVGKAAARLASAKTPAEAERARIALAAAQANLDRILAQQKTKFKI